VAGMIKSSCSSLHTSLTRERWAEESESNADFTVSMDGESEVYDLISFELR